MSIFGTIGKALGAVGKIGLGVVGKVTGVSGLANTFDKKPTATSGVQVATAGSLPLQPMDPAVIAKTPVNITATPLSSGGLPSWLLPAGIAAILVLLLSKR
ncbi:MAG: hypothetical protein V4577_19465 [Bacteroidota bacterium]